MDYEAVCVNNQDFPQLNLMEQFTRWQEIRHSVNCKVFTVAQDGVPLVYELQVGNRCPIDYPDTQIKNNCENPSIIDSLLDEVMVYSNSTKIPFINRFCAECNNVQPDDTIYVDPDFLCKDMATVKRRFSIMSRREFISYMRQSCTMYTDVLKLPLPTSRYRCAHPTCSPLCDLFTSNVYIDGSIYKNLFCGLCEEDLSNTPVKCPILSPYSTRGRTDGIVGSFSLILNFAEEEYGVKFDKIPSCLPGEVLDWAKYTCIKQTCFPPLLNIEGECHTFSISNNSTILNDSPNTAYMFIELTESIETTREKLDYIRETVLRTNRLVGYHNMPTTEMELTSVPCSNLTAPHEACKQALLYQFSMEVGSSANLFINKNILVEIARAFSEIMSLTVCQFTVLNYDPSSDIKCSGNSNSIAWHKDAELLTDALFTEQYLDEEAVMFRPNNSTDWYYTYSVALEVRFTRSLFTSPLIVSDEDFKAMSIVGGVCGSALLHCQKVVFQADFYAVESHNESSVKITFKTGKTKRWSMVSVDDIAYINDTILVTCVSYLHQAKLIPAYDTIQQWITACGITISIGFLIFTIASLTMFRELRTFPGRIMLRLCYSLVVAQFLFLAQMFLKSVAIVCKVAATLQHSAWLMVFSWMNVFAIDVGRTFIRMYRSGGSLPEGRMLYYDIYAWSVPLVIVCGCNAMEHVWGVLEYGAADSSGCWISPSAMILYVFAVPLALVLLVNISLFAATIVVFARTRILVKAAMEKHEAQQKKSMVISSVKLSLIIGMTWITGLLANIPALSFVWYVFTLLNTLQGVFLSLVFVCNKRVLEKYRKKIKSWRSTTDGSQSQSAGTKSTGTGGGAASGSDIPIDTVE